MPATILERPNTGDHAPAFANYLSQVPVGDLIAVLESQGEELQALSISEEKSLHRYAEGKWSIRELMGHMADAERVFAYRTLRASRNDKTPLPGFDEDFFVAEARFDERSLASLREELLHLRHATLSMLRGMSARALAGRGVANGAEFTALAVACVIAGHERHHLKILKERYL
jgi:DinB superfamily